MVDLASLAEKLATIPYFKALDQPTRLVIAQAAIPKKFTEEQVVFLEDEPCIGLYWLESGWLKAVKMSADGREQVIDFIGAGEVFNAIGVFANVNNPATVIALESVVLYVIPRATMLQLLANYPALAQEIIQDLSGRVVHLLGLIEDISLHTVEVRLARYLLEYAEDETLQRQRWKTQAELAARLGTVPHVLNRALRSLVEANFIEVQRQHIRILNRSGLMSRAE